tara:strand:+ start:21 stop:890 length:870 start_codon:yes stop_codon:yes gene_type:complete
MPQFARGTDQSREHERSDNSFYKGIVVKNWDPHKLHRVKIYVPEISNQPLENWLQEYKVFNMRFPGKNNEQDNWRDVDLYEEISKFLPWAEPCTSLLGENGPARYHSPTGIAGTTDANYVEEFEQNNEEPPTDQRGVWGPSFLYENFNTNMSDYFWWPTEQNNYAVNNNPYSFEFRPSNQVGKGKGLFCVPTVGSQVWLFHYRGDYNFPVYIGGRHSRRENVLINNEDALGGGGSTATGDPGGVDRSLKPSLDYPGIFENFPGQGTEIQRDASAEPTDTKQIAEQLLNR